MNLEFVMCVMTYSIAFDREYDRTIGGSVVGDATRIKLPTSEEYQEFYVEDFAADYVGYQYGKRPKPRWLGND